MLGDMFNEHGEEDNMMRLALKADPSSISGFGFEIWGVGYGENGEPYIYITKRGMWNRLEHEPDKYPAECRLSLAVPRYIQYNEMLTEEELEWVVTFLTNNYEQALKTNDFNTVFEGVVRGYGCPL